MKEFLAYFFKRIKRDNIFIESGSLAFTSTLALVPALTIVLSVFALVPSFAPLRKSLENFITKNFVPVLSENISTHLSNFISHAGSLTVTSSLFLFVVALMLVRAIDKSINRIFRGNKRKLILTFAIYWTILTVGPILVSLSIYFPSVLIAYAFSDKQQLNMAMQMLYLFIPIIIELFVIFSLFVIMPVTTIRYKNALYGSIFTVILLEISKRAFSAFIINFSDYQAIYGALALIPILFIWINLTWILVLIGAEFTSCLSIFNKSRNSEMVDIINTSKQNKFSDEDQNINKNKKSINIKIN